MEFEKSTRPALIKYLEKNGYKGLSNLKKDELVNIAKKANNKTGGERQKKGKSLNKMPTIQENNNKKNKKPHIKPFPNPNAPEFFPKRNSKEYKKTKKAINDDLYNIRSILKDGNDSLLNYKRISQVYAKKKKEQLKKLKDEVAKIKGLKKDNKDKGKLVYAKKAFERLENDYIKLEKDFLNKKTNMEERKIKLYDELLENQKEFRKHFNHRIEDTYALPFAVRTVLKGKYDELIEKNKDIISHLKSGLMRKEVRKIVNKGNEELNRLKNTMNVLTRKKEMNSEIKIRKKK